MRLLVHVEGQTEETFVNTILGPHLHNIGYSSVRASLIGSAGPRNKRGGGRSWQTVRRGILNHLKEDREAIATTMVDYYAMPRDWPGRIEADSLPFERQTSTILNALVQSIKEKMGSDFDQRRFIPYVSMHEFEALFFGDYRRFAKSVGRPDIAGEMEAILTQFGDPETIDDSPETAPSKRILQLVGGYRKGAIGTKAVQNIDLATIRSRCQNFDRWLTRLERA